MFTNYWRRFGMMPMLAPEGGAGGEGGEPKGNEPPAGGNGGNEPPAGGEPPKTFTQDELSRIAAQEKRQGMSSVLKALGFEKEEDAQAFIKKYRDEENNKKDDLTRANETLAAEKKAKEEAEKKAELVEKKFKVVSVGVPAENVDDIVVLATAKAVDGKSFDDALEDLKKVYPSLFKGSSESGKGTGTGGNPPRGKGGNNGGGSIGKRLAEQKKTSTQSKKSYFSN